MKRTNLGNRSDYCAFTVFFCLMAMMFLFQPTAQAQEQGRDQNPLLNWKENGRNPDDFEVLSLLPSGDAATEVDDGDGKTRTKTFIVPVTANAALTVVATPDRAVQEAELPYEWTLTGGTGNGKLSRTVSLDDPGKFVLNCKCGTSWKKTTVIVYKMELTNIKFNYDTASSVHDAINIRHDYTIPYDISNGEWNKAGNNNPVCYTANHSVSIKARFEVEPADITSAGIWAVSTDSDGSLGNVMKTTVTFSAGVSSPEYVTFQISGNTPNCVKKTTTDTWQWKHDNVNSSGSGTYDFSLSGSHTVYTILNEPVSPWNNAGGSQRNVWTTALDFTIANASCNGDASALEALSHITQYLHSGHGLTYDTEHGESTYASSHLGGSFNLTGYINKTKDNVINCYDQAGGVCALGHLLGIPVNYRFMSPFGYINTVNLVGEGNCNNPFYLSSTSHLKIAGMDDIEPVRTCFYNHAFAEYNGVVFDACAGPAIGTLTIAQYLSNTIDRSTAAENANAGNSSNICSGFLNAIY